MGRKTNYNQEQADRIVTLLQGISLRAICRIKGMPTRATIERWKIDNPDFAAKCQRAWEIRADSEFDKMEEIENKMLAGTVDHKAARSVLSSMQWRLEKMKPKVYARVVIEKGVDDRAHTITGGLPDDEPK